MTLNVTGRQDGQLWSCGGGIPCGVGWRKCNEDWDRLIVVLVNHVSVERAEYLQGHIRKGLARNKHTIAQY
jgi:hypothetical protein